MSLETLVHLVGRIEVQIGHGNEWRRRVGVGSGYPLFQLAPLQSHGVQKPVDDFHVRSGPIFEIERLSLIMGIQDSYLDHLPYLLFR